MGLSSETDADIARVTEALAMITPRWNVRILLALAAEPLRYHELAARLPWLKDSQFHPKTRTLCDAGLVERTEHSPRHVTYGLTDRGAALLPVLPVIVTWAEAHLEEAAQPPSTIEQIEDSLTLLTRRHAAGILWALKIRGETSGRALFQLVMPHSAWSNIYPPLRQLAVDGLVDTDGPGRPYRLSAAGEALGPVLGALSAWAAGKPFNHAAHHPVWGHTQPLSAPKPRAGHPTRPTTTPPAVPRPGGARPSYSDLFSHATPAGPPAALPAGGPNR
ncbi:MarR family transcriptional regulator [Streptomyces sp. CNQ-509]|nr:MarR family transcriptional regulator [Streptomyces sp. CNQ-509]